MTPIYVPTKPYIKAWLQNTIPSGIADKHHHIGGILHQLLESDANHQGSKMVTYSTVATLYVKPDAAKRVASKLSYTKLNPEHVIFTGIKQSGGWLNVSQAMMFNNIAGKIIRDATRTYVLTYLEFDPRLKKAIEYAQSRMNLSDDLLPYDNIKKDFQRYRARYGGPTLYKPRIAKSLVN